jgi:putative salt-induced outer membrane protein YdiY
VKRPGGLFLQIDRRIFVGMRPLHVTVLIAAIGLSPLPLAAQDTVQAKRVEFTADLGFVNTSGNANVTTFNLGDKLVLRTRDSSHIVTQLFGLVYGRSEGETVADNWRASGRYEHSINSHVYLYALLGMDRDRLAGVSRRFEESLGLTWKAATGPRTELSLEGGVSLIQERPTVGAADNFVAGRASALFLHKLRENVSFTQGLEFLPNLEEGDDYRINSETAIVASVSRNISFKTSYAIRFDNTPEPGFTSTDRLLTTGLQIRY